MANRHRPFARFLSSERLRATVAGLCACLAGVASWSSSSYGQADYPTAPVTIIVTFAPGGGTDVIARLIAPHMQQALGKPVVIENRGGAGGNLGMGIAARAKSDGYTVMMTSSPFLVNPALYRNVPYDPFKDFEPISELAIAPDVLVVHPNTGIKNVAELVRQARANPDKFNYATAGVGTTPHLAVEQLKLLEKIHIVHIPYPGAGPAIPALISGVTQVGSFFLPPVSEHIKAGSMTAIAVGSAGRWPDLPDVATFVEAGYKDLLSETVILAFAPGGTPRPIVDRLNKEMAAALRSPEVKSRAERMGYKVVASKPEELAARIARDVPAFKQLIRQSGIPLQ